MRGSCQVCGKSIVIQPTGRPRKYCSHRCKKRAERRADRAAEVRSQVAVSPQGFADAPCHVCGRNPATVGVPRPLLCTSCATVRAAV